MKEKTMTRTVLARASGVHPETIRFYENQRILPAPRRNVSGYRLYTELDVERIRFAQRAQALGFTLKEVRELMVLQHGGSAARIKAMAEKKLLDISEKIRDLQVMHRQLKKVSELCSGDGSSRCCPILRSISKPTSNRRKS